MSAVHVSCRARARNILTPSSDMIVPAMTSSIASSPVIIPPCSSWEPKRPGRARPPLRHARTRDGPAHLEAARAFSSGSKSSPRSRCLHFCGETPPDQRSNARVKAAGSEKLRAAEICASGSSVSDTSCRATSNSELVEHGPESRACRLEIAIERAPVDGEPARSVVAGAAAGGETLAQAAFQLIDQIGAGNRLELADGFLDGASALGVGRAHPQAEVPGRKDERRQLLVEPNGRAEERSQRGAVVRHAAGEVHLRRGPVAAAELAERADDRREQAFR